MCKYVGVRMASEACEAPEEFQNFQSGLKRRQFIEMQDELGRGGLMRVEVCCVTDGEGLREGQDPAKTGQLMGRPAASPGRHMSE